MKKALCFLMLAGAACAAQQAPSQNPVTDNVRQQLARQSKILVETAEAMPADKYSFKPTPENMTFAHLMEHVLESNNLLCSKISGMAAPADNVKDTDAKEKIVAGVKESMDFCTKAMADVKDAQLTDPVELWGGRKANKAAAVIGLTNDWADHYGAAAIYLRLSGVLPPTAKARQAAASNQKGMEKKSE